MEVLAELPLTRHYVRVYSLAKNYMHQTRVYPMTDTTFRGRVRNVWENLALDIFKQLGGKKTKKDKVHVGQTLGGSPAR